MQEKVPVRTAARIAFLAMLVLYFPKIGQAQTCSISAFEGMSAADIIAAQQLEPLRTETLDSWIVVLTLLKCPHSETYFIAMRTRKAEYLLLCPSVAAFDEWATHPQPGEFFHKIRYDPQYLNTDYTSRFGCRHVRSTGWQCARNAETGRSYCYQH